MVRQSTSKPRISEGLMGDADSAEGVSVGLEWKLLFPLLARRVDDPQPDDRRCVVEAQCEDDEQTCLVQAHECVAKTIRECGEKAVTAHTLSKEGTEEKDFWNSTWIVKKANSAEPMAKEKLFKGYVWVPVEICSPKLRIKDAGTRDRVEGVLNALNSSYRLAANCSCEVHIHLGRMDDRSWSLPTLKRLGSLLWLAEPTLRSIRDPNSANFDNTYTWGFAMRQHSRLAKMPRGLSAQPRSVRMANPVIEIPDELAVAVNPRHTAALAKEVDALSEIQKAASHLELGRLLSGSEKKYRRLGFNFSAFGEEDERARRNPRTMEFRFMEGSVSTELILSWLTICGAIIEMSVVSSDNSFAAILGPLMVQRAESRHTTASGFNEMRGARRARQFRELMKALGVSEANYRGFEEKIKREY